MLLLKFMQYMKICSQVWFFAFLTASITHDPLFRGLSTTTCDTQLIILIPRLY